MEYDEAKNLTQSGIFFTDEVKGTDYRVCVLQALKVADSLSKNGYNGMLDLMRQADRSDIRKAIENLTEQDGMISKRDVLEVLKIKKVRYGI